MVIAFLTLSFDDPLSAYVGHWYTYNAWQVNMGSWVNSLPGALAPGTPDHQVAYPLLIVPGAYIVVFLLVTKMGAAIMRRAQARWAGIPRIGLAAICYAVMVPFDLDFRGNCLHAHGFLGVSRWTHQDLRRHLPRVSAQ